MVLERPKKPDILEIQFDSEGEHIKVIDCEIASHENYSFPSFYSAISWVQFTAFEIGLEGEGYQLYKLERYEEAVTFYKKALGENPENHQVLNNLGLALHELGEYKKAIASYDEANSIKSDNMAWNNRGLALYRLERYEEAIASYDKALKIKSNSHIAWNNRGNALFSLGKYQEAVKSYDKASKFKFDSNIAQFKQRKRKPLKDKTHKRSDNFYPVWYNRGNALLRLGRYEQAIDSYSKALRYNPTEYEAFYNKGNALFFLKRYEEAIKSYDSCLRFHKECFQALNNRGNALSLLGSYEEAIESYDKALEKLTNLFYDNINKSYILYNKGNTLFKLGRYEDAISNYNASLNFNNNYYTWNNLGNAQFQLSLYEDAIDSYQKALQIKSDYLNALYNIGNCHSRNGRYLEAVESYNSLLAIKSDYYAAWNNQGNALKHLYNHTQASESYQNVLQHKSDTYHLSLHNLSCLYFDNGYLQKAFLCYSELLKIQQYNYKHWLCQGRVLFELGRYEEAIESYRQALKIKPDSYIAWCNQGTIQFKTGRYEEAIESYKQALKIKPNYLYALYNLCLTLCIAKKYSEALNNYNKNQLFTSNLFQNYKDFGNALSEIVTSKDKIYSDVYISWFNRGVLLYKIGLYHDSIHSFNQALKYKKDYHQAWYWHGQASYQLELYNQAIYSFEQALKYNRNYYEAWYWHGKILYDNGRYHEAIDSYEQALKIRPSYYEALHERGKILYKLGRYYEAIDSYGQALRFKPDDLHATYNRGLALSELGRSRLGHNEAEDWLKGAIHDFNRVLKFNNQIWLAWVELAWATFYYSGYEEALKKWTEALQALQSVTPANPEGCGVLYHTRGRAHYEYGIQKQQETISSAYWRTARNDYREALEFFCIQNLGEQRLEVLIDLIKVCRDLGEIEQVRALSKDATSEMEELLRNTTNEKRKIQIKRKFAGFVELRVDTLAQSLIPNNRIKAIEEAEQHKNDCLSWLRNNDTNSNNVEISSKYVEIQKLLNSHTALIYWHISSVAITTFILRHQKPPVVWQYNKSPIIWIRFLQNVLAWLNQLTKGKGDKPFYPPATLQLQKFECCVADWKQNYQNYFQQGNLKQDLTGKLASISDILNIRQISRYLHKIDQLILIPHRNLHLLPLETLFPKKFTISRLPSAQIGIAKLDDVKEFSAKQSFTSDIDKYYKTNSTQSLSLLNIENPRNDLHFASIESAAISQIYPPFKHLQGHFATREQVSIALQKNIPHAIFHFTGHGYHNVDEPLESALYLAGKEILTLRDIFSLNLNQYELVCLSACESGITGKKDLIDEFVGIASGFLAVGVTHVISSLWRVNDISTALIMIKFYENLKSGLTVPYALKAAQIYLRDSTQADLLVWSQQLAVNETLKQEIKALLDWFDADEKPFTEPRYWAAFCPIGLV